MSLRAIHTCTGCVPVDRSIIDAYVGLLNINTNASAAEAARVESEEEREQQFSADHARAVADHDAVAAATTAATNAASAATNAATAANSAASGASYAATYATEAAEAASEAVDEARDAADAAAETASKSPYIGGNGKWFVYDPKDQDYVDTNIKARGDKGDKGDTGEQGPQGIQGERGPAGVTSVEVSVSPSTGTPSGSGSVTNGVLSLSFSGLKGETGAQGATGAQGPQGPQGNTGSSVDYPYELVNNCTTDDATKGLSAAQGKVLQDELSQLGQEVDDLDGELGVLHNSLSIPDNTQTVLFNNLDIKAGDTFYLKVVSSVAWTRLYITPTGANDKILDNQYVSSQFEGGFVAKINITTIKCVLRVSSTSSVSCTLKINASRDIERNEISVGLLRDSLRQNIEQSQNLFDQFNKVDFGSLLTDTRSAPYSCIRHCSITGAGITLKFEQGTYTASNIIPVVSQGNYLSNVNIRVLVYYDAMMAIVGSYFTTTPALEQITIPNGVAFIRLIVADTAFDGEKIVFCKGSTIAKWEKPYRIGENVDSLVELRRRSANLIDPQTILENVAISVSGSSVYTTSSNDKYNSVLDLPLDSGVTYLVGPVRVYQLLNSDKSAVLGYSGTMQYGYFEITPNQDALLSFSVLKANIPFVCVKGKADSYEPFGEMVNTDLFNKMVEYASPLHGKKLYNFGDSVSAGDGNQLRGAADILGEELGFQVWDYAVGGATMTDQTAEHPTISCVQKQIENAPSQSPDIVLIAGGINDLSYAQIGDAPVVSSALDFNASYINNVDKTKISGALESAISKAINKWPTASIVYMYEHKMYAHAGGTMVQLHDVAIAVCKKWSVPVLDMMDYGGINLAIPIYKQLYGANNGEDGTHITESGYRKFYLPRLRAILESVCQMNGE